MNLTLVLVKKKIFFFSLFLIPSPSYRAPVLYSLKKEKKKQGGGGGEGGGFMS